MTDFESKELQKLFTRVDIHKHEITKLKETNAKLADLIGELHEKIEHGANNAYYYNVFFALVVVGLIVMLVGLFLL